MAKIPNQNNIISIIKSHVTSLMDVISVCTNRLHNMGKYLSKEKLKKLKELKTYSEAMKNLSENITNIVNTFAEIDYHKSRIYIKKFSKLVNYLTDNLDCLIKLSKKAKGIDNQSIHNILTAVIDVKSIMEEVNSIKKKDFKKFIKNTKRLKKALRALISVVKILNKKSMKALSDETVKKWKNNMDLIVDISGKIKIISENLQKVKLKKFLSLPLKMVLIRKTIKKSQKLINTINNISKMDVAEKKITSISIIFDGIYNIYSRLRSIKIRRLLILPLKMALLRKTMKSFQKIINIINNIKYIQSAEKKVAALKFIIGSLANLILSMIIMLPVIMFFIIISPVVVLFFMIFGLIMRVVVKSIGKMIDGRIFASIITMTLVLVAFIGMAAVLWIIAKLSKEIIKGAKNLLKFFLLIIAITAIVAILGLLLKIATPVLLTAAIGIVSLTVVIGLLLLTAVFLEKLQEIHLDKDKISSNVKMIMDVSWEIVLAIFNKEDPEGNEPRNKWYRSALRVAKGLGSILGAILAVAFVAATFVSITFILLIAGELTLLQKVHLDPESISNNVKNIIDTANLVICCIFGKPEKEDNHKSTKNWIIGVLKRFGQGLSLIVDAIMAVAFLAATFVSITFILLIAGELMLLQKVHLEKSTIMQNVSDICEVAGNVIDALWDPIDKKYNPSTKTVFDKIFKFFGLSRLVSILDAIFAIAFLALSLISIFLIMLIGIQLKKIGDMKFSSKTITDKVKEIIKTANSVIDAIWDPKDEEDNKSQKDWFSTVVDWCGFKKLSAIWGAIQNIAYLALTLASISMVAGIAKHLESISKAKVNCKYIVSKVTTITEAANAVIKSVNKPDTSAVKPADSVWTGLLKFFGKDDKTIAAMQACGYLTQVAACIEALAHMTKSFVLISQFKAPANLKSKINDIIDHTTLITKDVIGLFKGDNAKYDIDDDDAEDVAEIIKQYSSIITNIVNMSKQMLVIDKLQMPAVIEGENTTQAKKNLKVIIDFMDTVIKDMVAIAGGSFTIDAAGGKISFTYMKGMKLISEFASVFHTSVTKNIGQLSKELNSLATWRNSHMGVEGAKAILKQATDISKEMATLDITLLNGAEDRSKKINNIMKNVTDIFPKDNKGATLESRLNFIQRSTNQYMKFMDKVNSMDMQKLQSAERLFEHMADFSQSINGNFQELAEALNEKIAPLLEELKNIMSKIPQKMEDIAVGDVKPEIDDSSGPGTGDTVTTQVTDENPMLKLSDQLKSTSTGESAAKRLERIKAFNRNRTSAISEEFMSISEILDVLTGTGVYTNGVKVHMT